MNTFEFINRHPRLDHILVSNKGMVITTTATRNGNRMAVLKPRINDTGYVVYKIDKKTVLAHRLVAETFLSAPLIEGVYDVDHIDGNKQNNDYRNLRWVEHAENCSYRNTHQARKDKYIVLAKDGSVVGSYSNRDEIADDLEIGVSSVAHVLSGRWKQCRGYQIMTIDEYKEKNRFYGGK